MAEKIWHANLKDTRTHGILKQVFREGPVNAYTLEKSSGLAHSTFWGIFQPLVKLRYVELDSKKRFRTGLDTKYYRISAGGFFELVNALSEKDDIWSSLPDILAQNARFCPWLSDQVKLMGSIGSKELLKRYIHTCISAMRGGMRLSGVAYPARSPCSESECVPAIVVLLLEILYPDTDIGAFGVWPSHFPHARFNEKLSTKELRNLQEEVKRYLSHRKDLAEYIRKGLDQGELQLGRITTDLRRVQADFAA